ncbi:MAG TPA: pantoate--beta-alanine ligase [Gemmatimonadaceae bacterium]|nr:pantoate--beta-alanine ligase [Gemmatimonadaceae bacterium]
MIVAKTVEALRSARRRGMIGFVPTMGYLHDGHLALVRRAREECDAVVVSIFVNPTQFGPGEDFATYPRDLERDLGMLQQEKVDLAFVPDEGGFYPPGADTFVEPGAVALPLEGERRPGHFRGVATVVTMLCNAVRPYRAYFGEKDWQQLQVVRRMVRDLHQAVEIVPVPVVREPDGLAMSSRNVRLSAEERIAARCVPRALDAARAAYATGETDPGALERAMAAVVAAEPAATLDYAVVVDAEALVAAARASESSRALIAARVGSVRLIDNSALV